MMTYFYVIYWLFNQLHPLLTFVSSCWSEATKDLGRHKMNVL